MSASILDLVPALILVPNPSERLGHRKYTLPSPKPVTLAPSAASHVVRRNERRLTRGFFASCHGHTQLNPGPRKKEPFSTSTAQNIRNIVNSRIASLRFSGRIDGFLSK